MAKSSKDVRVAVIFFQALICIRTVSFFPTIRLALVAWLLLTCCHCSRMSGRYRRKYLRGKLSMSGQVEGLCHDTSSRRAFKRTGVAVTRSGGSGLTAGWEKKKHEQVLINR